MELLFVVLLFDEIVGGKSDKEQSHFLCGFREDVTALSFAGQVNISPA
jgi:hypothetical protein